MQDFLNFLAVSQTDDLEGKIKCISSKVYTSLNYFISKEGFDFLSSQFFANIEMSTQMLEDNPQIWLATVCEVSDFEQVELNMKTFFPTEIDLIARYGEAPVNSGRLDISWIDLVIENKYPELTAAQVNGVAIGLIDVDQRDIVTLAEYDTAIAFLKQLKSPALEQRFLKSFLETFYVFNVFKKEDTDVIKVLLDSLLVGLQMSKNVQPESARTFLSFVMKNYLTQLSAEGRALCNESL